MNFSWLLGMLIAASLSCSNCVTCSDDVNMLEPVVTRLSQTVNQLQAELTALQQRVEQSEPTVLFSVQRSDLYFNVSTGNTILFDTILINTGGGYSAVDGEFTAPVAGLYHVSYRGWSNRGYGGFVGMKLNGHAISEIPVGDTSYQSASSQSSPLHLQQGDILSVYGSLATDGRNYIQMMGGYRTTFMGYLLEQD